MNAVFDEKTARKKARAYERKGVDGDAKRIVDFVRARLSGPYTVLDVGGGVGEIELALLKDGATSAVNVELASTYETSAAELIRKHGLGDRIQRRVGDFVAEASTLAPVDVVVMNRVVCCDPRPVAMVEAAAEHARRYLVITVPVERWWIRAGLAIANLFLTVRGISFRGYVHPTRALIGAAERHGLRLVAREPALIFQLLAFERSAA